MASHIKGDLVAYWSKGRKDVIFSSTDGPGATTGRRLVYHAFAVTKMGEGEDAKTFLDDLEARGFDLSTIRFSINRKSTADNARSHVGNELENDPAPEEDPRGRSRGGPYSPPDPDSIHKPEAGISAP